MSLCAYLKLVLVINDLQSRDEKVVKPSRPDEKEHASCIPKHFDKNFYVDSYLFYVPYLFDQTPLSITRRYQIVASPQMVLGEIVTTLEY